MRDERGDGVPEALLRLWPTWRTWGVKVSGSYPDIYKGKKYPGA